jgi:hypothetical protein
MPLIQGGPPEWIWERPPDKVRWELVPTGDEDQDARYELRMQSGLEIIRCHFFSREEISDLATALANGMEGIDAMA